MFERRGSGIFPRFLVVAGCFLPWASGQEVAVKTYRELWFKHLLGTCRDSLCACSPQDDCDCPLVGIEHGEGEAPQRPTSTQRLLFCSALLSGADEALVFAAKSFASAGNFALGLGAYSLRQSTAHVQIWSGEEYSSGENSSRLTDDLRRSLSVFGVPVGARAHGRQHDVPAFDEARFHERPRLKVDAVLPAEDAALTPSPPTSSPFVSPTSSSPHGYPVEVLFLDLCGSEGANRLNKIPDQVPRQVGKLMDLRWIIFACAEAFSSVQMLNEVVGGSQQKWMLLVDEESAATSESLRIFVRESVLEVAPLSLERLGSSLTTWRSRPQQPEEAQRAEEQEQQQQQQQQQQHPQGQKAAKQEGEAEHEEFEPRANMLRRGSFFSGYANPCRYVEINNGLLGLNHFPDYSGSESFEEIQEAISKYCLSPPGAPVCTEKRENFEGEEDSEVWAPRWISEEHFRSVSLGIGQGDCGAGLRSSAYKHQASSDQIFADFSLLIKLFLDYGVSVTGFFVNLGAADGIWSDPLTRYSQLSHSGVAVELDPKRCEAYRRNFPRIDLLCIRLSLETLPEIASRIPIGGYDVLKVDLDAYDCVIIWELLTRYQHRPSVIILEVNLAFPPPFEFAMDHHPAWDQPHNLTLPYHLGHGCSLSYATRMLSKTLPAPNYVLFQVSKTDAMFLRADVAAAVLGTAELPDEFQCFQSGLIEVHGVLPDRLRKWFFTQDLGTTLREMAAMVREELQQSLGPLAGLEAKFQLSAGGLQQEDLDHRKLEAHRSDPNTKSELAGICEGGRLWYGFRESVG